MEDDQALGYNLNRYKNAYFNESLADLVRNVNVKDRIIEHDKRLVQQIDPIFHMPETPQNPLNYRTHFFAPEKHFLNHRFSTFSFNVIVIWLMSIFLYLALYFELFKRLVDYVGNITIGKKD
jgi:hypothetical protein